MNKVKEIIKKLEKDILALCEKYQPIIKVYPFSTVVFNRFKDLGNILSILS